MPSKARQPYGEALIDKVTALILPARRSGTWVELHYDTKW